MPESIHLIIGTPHNAPVFSRKEDIGSMKRYLGLYSHRMQVPIAGYRFEERALHLLVGAHDKLRDFLEGVLEAYKYYYSLHYTEDVRLVHKQRRLGGAKEKTQLLRFLHHGGENSLDEYKNYSRYIKRELVSVSLGWSLMSGEFSDRESFLRQMVREPEPAYAEAFASAEAFEPDKLTKRRARAKQFLDAFLERKGMSLSELMRFEYRHVRVELVRAFREETDLSFRDIGFVLGMSHTSVIRILRED